MPILSERALLCAGRRFLACRLGYGLGFSRLFLEIVLKDWCEQDSPEGFWGLYICANYLCE